MNEFPLIAISQSGPNTWFFSYAGPEGPISRSISINLEDTHSIQQLAKVTPLNSTVFVNKDDPTIYQFARAL
jgi:hypothetical protein